MSPVIPYSWSVVLFSLYFSQGFPAGLLAHVLPGVLRDQGVGLEYIGLLKLLALPWLLKFLWAPWMDRGAPLGMGRRFGTSRSWILPLHGISLLSLALLAAYPPSENSSADWLIFLAAIFLINFASASQDVATDGLAVRLLPKNGRGWGNALQAGGYKSGMILSSSLLLIAIGLYGWSSSLLFMLPVMALLWVPIWRFPEAAIAAVQTPADEKSAHESEKASAWRYLITTFSGFARRPGLGIWLLLLMAYKVPDGLASAMIKPVLIDQGMTLADLGVLTFWSSLAGLAAVFLAGILVDRIGAISCLSGFALLQAIALAGCIWLSDASLSRPLVWAIIAFEQIADSFATVALFAAMMHMCRAAHEGADFTLQACLQILIVGMASTLSGFLAAQFGYNLLFLSAALIAVLVALATMGYARYAWPRQDPRDGLGASSSRPPAA